ncbi:hypothetical protein [Embleya sp. NBC_00896]|uniref:hypothetical protein n=1 Tax=Embleya sp. NBC_00896 TaxID=2975961 RepID=UPI002F90FB8A|nr:hypothetical protein OG928_46820 [Embleya sp. NBC_00896]
MGPDVTALDIMSDIATGRHRVPLEEVGPWRFPEFEALVEDAMTLAATERRHPSLTR